MGISRLAVYQPKRILTVPAAVDGQGVCIGRSTYVNDDLRAGRLVAPFGLKLKSDMGFYLVTPLATADSSKIAAFRNWLIASARKPLTEPAFV